MSKFLELSSILMTGFAFITVISRSRLDHGAVIGFMFLLVAIGFLILSYLDDIQEEIENLKGGKKEDE